MLGLERAAIVVACVATAGCADAGKVTPSDLEVLCSAARAVSTESHPAEQRASDMIGIVLKKDISAGMKKMLSTELITQGDKGQVITEWRQSSGLTDFSCPPLESIYPGSTSSPTK